MSSPAQRRDPNASILVEFKRMAPVWGIVLGAAVIALVSIRFTGAHFLREGIFESDETCRIAEIYQEAGKRHWNSMRQDVATNLEGKAASGERNPKSAGLMAGDERVAAARQELQKAIEYCPTLASAYVYLADIAWWAGDQAQSHFEQARAHEVYHELPMAMAEYQAALETEPSLEKARLALADVATRLNRWDEARATLDGATAEQQDSAPALRARAAIALHEGERQRAKDLYRESLAKEPTNRVALMAMLALSKEMEEGSEGAQYVYELLERERVGDASLFHAVALVFIQNQQWKPALSALDRAVGIAPNSVELHFDRAVALYRLGEKDKARVAAERAMDLNFEKYQQLVVGYDIDPATS
ncbi:MAG: tetratricopeptide repeat protein [Sumerlaeia bacterium]